MQFIGAQIQRRYGNDEETLTADRKVLQRGLRKSKKQWRKSGQAGVGEGEGDEQEKYPYPNTENSGATSQYEDTCRLLDRCLKGTNRI